MDRKLVELLAKRTDDPMEIIGGLMSKDHDDNRRAGASLQRDAAAHGVNLREYLELTIAPQKDYSGYELALAKLGLPIRDDYKNGIVLEAAGDTFQTRPGTRVLFDEVISDVLRWKVRQDNIENAEPLLASSRTITGPEMTKKVTVDDGDDDNRGTRFVAEGGRIPVRSLVASDTAVKIWKHGMALRTTYEFGRRVRLDVVTPYMARIVRQLELSKTAAATSVLLNGDGNGNAAAVVDQSSLTPTGAPAAVAGTIQWNRFFLWLVNRAKAGVPIDTVAMNYDGYYQWGMMFAPNNNNNVSLANALSSVGVEIDRNPIFDQKISPVLSSTVPANNLIGFNKGETLEELVEANSQIEEESRETLNQTITITKTENTGYHLLYDDTREVYDFGA